jgi:hypothetical protein
MSRPGIVWSHTHHRVDGRPMPRHGLDCEGQDEELEV